MPDQYIFWFDATPLVAAGQISLKTKVNLRGRRHPSRGCNTYNLNLYKTWYNRVFLHLFSIFLLSDISTNILWTIPGNTSICKIKVSFLADVAQQRGHEIAKILHLQLWLGNHSFSYEVILRNQPSGHSISKPNKKKEFLDFHLLF